MIDGERAAHTAKGSTRAAACGSWYCVANNQLAGSARDQVAKVNPRANPRHSANRSLEQQRATSVSYDALSERCAEAESVDEDAFGCCRARATGEGV